MKLYQIAQELNDFFINLEESGGQLTELDEKRLQKLSNFLTTKTDNCVEYLNSKTDLVDAIERRISELKVLKERVNKHINSYSNYVLNCMNNLNKDVIKGELYQIKKSIRKSESVEIENEDLIPVEFTSIETVVKINKNDIKKAMKNGPVAGCHLNKKENVTVKFTTIGVKDE